MTSVLRAVKRTKVRFTAAALVIPVIGVVLLGMVFAGQTPASAVSGTVRIKSALMIGEWGPNSLGEYTDNASSIALVLNWATENADVVKAVVYFNNIAINGTPMSRRDFLLAHHPKAAAEFKRILSSSDAFLYQLAR